MATELYTHPSPEQLRAFAQGRLRAAEMAELEQHIAYCDSCCLHLAGVPDDTLVQLAREAATEGVKSPAGRSAPPPKPSAGEIPKELRDHPRYRVLSLVGHGGMGAVYKAEHRKMERLVALKVVNQHLLANPQAVERFAREVRAVSKLSHPNIVLVHDADEADGLHFLVMEFVDGVSLDRVVAHNGPLTPAQAANFIAQAAKGLQHAHEKGMVHRDIKPQNLMMTRKKEIKILDFGLARLASEQSFDQAQGGDDRPLKPGQTTAGMVLGTPDYIAPEQATDARTADIRADIYSLGCTLYYLLTGQPPFPTGSSIEKLNAHLHSAPPPISSKRGDVPAELARILDKMLAKNPQDRYQTPAEAFKDLSQLPRGESPASGKRQPPGNADTRAPLAAPQDTPTIITTAPAGALAPLPSTAPSDFGPSLFDDFNLDSSLPPLTPVIKPPNNSGLPFGATPQVAVLLGLGLAAALMLLAWGVANAFFGDDDSPKLAQQSSNPSSSGAFPVEPSPRTTPSANAPPIPPRATATSALRPASPTASSSNQIGSNLPRKVLLVIPSYGVWRNDYEYVAKACDYLDIDLTVASTSRGQAMDTEGQPVVVPDRVLDKGLYANEFGAIIFAGKSTNEYRGGGVAAAEAHRVIREFLGQNKIVSSICVGREVLDNQGFLTNRNFAKCPHLGEPLPNVAGRVVKDGQFITASTDAEAKRLLEAIDVYLADF
jgi:serine/threonine protein kinase